MTTAIPLRSQQPAGKQLVAAGFWALLAFAGMSLLMGQLVELVQGAPVLDAISLAALGAWFATLGIYRANLRMRRATSNRAAAARAATFVAPTLAAHH